jgi:hypothetical protein
MDLAQTVFGRTAGVEIPLPQIGWSLLMLAATLFGYSITKMINPPEGPVRTPWLTIRRLHIAGAIVLCAGLAIAAALFLSRGNSTLPEDDNSTLGYYKTTTRQAGELYGKSAVVVDDLSSRLKQPRTQAMIVGITSVVLGMGCFFLARWLESGSDDGMAANLPQKH